MKHEKIWHTGPAFLPGGSWRKHGALWLPTPTGCLPATEGKSKLPLISRSERVFSLYSEDESDGSRVQVSSKSEDHRRHHRHIMLLTLTYALTVCQAFAAINTANSHNHPRRTIELLSLFCR